MSTTNSPLPRMAALALSRFGLGARFDLSGTEAVALTKDPRGFLKAALKPDAALLSSPDLADTKSNLMDFFEQQQQKKQMRDMATAATSAMQPPPTADVPKPMGVQREVLLTEAQARYQKAFMDQTGFVERLVWFWSNHFCVSIAKGQQITDTAGSFEREAIRPHVFGKFANMLRAVEQHPSMLFYLDNRDSIGPNSQAGQRRQKGLNENLAREILELHTLGVNGGYTQADVTSLARMITGWTFPGLNSNKAEPAVFVFNPNAHEPGDHKLLNKTYTQQGIAQGEAALDFLAAQPATAKHVATKFARHFVADDPPQDLVGRLATVFTKSGGDLLALTTALIDDDAAWTPTQEKLRTPQEFIIAASRALNLPPEKPQLLMRALNELGQPLWKPSGPNGFADTVQQWASSEGMKVRLSYAALMAKQSQVAGNPTEVAQAILGDAASPDTSQAIARAESKAQGLALLLMSPEFQRR